MSKPSHPNPTGRGYKLGPQSEDHKAKISAAQKGKPRPYLLGNQHAAGSGGSSTSFKTGEQHVGFLHGHTWHGGASLTYRSWQNMKNRCLNPNHSKFAHYGGRGITVCPRWLKSFENFLTDMSERPQGMTLDRIDPDGNYEPANCRWADKNTQNRNTRRSKAI